MKIQLKGRKYTHRPHPWSQNVSGRNVGVSQRNTVLNRNRRLLLWWSQLKKDMLPPPLDPPVLPFPSLCPSPPVLLEVGPLNPARGSVGAL